MKPNRFFGLHAHTAIGSPFDGLGKPEEHFDFVLENGGQGIAITEHGNMNSFAGAYLYSEQLKKKGRSFRFVPGIEFYFHPDLDQWALDMQKAKEEREAKKKAGEQLEDEEGTTTVEDESATKSGKKFDPLKRRHHLIALPKTPESLRSLFELVSFSYVEGRYFFPRVDLKRLKQIGKDLILSTACIGGPFARIVFDHQTEPDFEKWEPNDDNHDIIMVEMENLLDQFVDVVGEENMFLELQFNKLGAQHLVNKYLIELSKKTGIKLLAAADSHYPRPELWQAREMYKQLGWLGKRDDKSIPKSIDELKCELYPKNADQMWDTYQLYGKKYDFYDDQTVCEAIERSHDVAFDLIDNPEPDRKVKLPSYTVPEGETPIKALVRMAKEGLVSKGLHKNKEYVERLKSELEVIKNLKFAEYFLAKKAIIDLAKKKMLVGFGRGCLTGDALVLTVCGYKQLKDLKKGEKIYDVNGTISDVDQVYQYDVDEELLKIKTSYSFDEIILTKDHKLCGSKSKVVDGFYDWSVSTQKAKKKYQDFVDVKEWLPADFFDVGDWLFMPYPERPKLNDEYSFSLDSFSDYGVVKQEKILESRGRKECLSINSSIKCNNDFMYFIGRWIGDGWIRYNRYKDGRTNYHLGVAFHSNDHDGINRISDYLKSLGFQTTLTKHKKKQLIQLHVFNKTLVSFMRSLFPDYKKKPNTKYIPEFFFSCSNEKLSYLLEGLIDSDGHRSNDLRISIDTTSRKLACDLKRLLLYLKIPSSVTTRQSYRREPFVCSKSYKIRFHNGNRKVYPNIRFSTNGYYVKILSKQNIKQKTIVYDLTIKNGHSSYCTSNFVVHNSAASSLVCYCLGITGIDPLKYGLLFSRFLSANRKELPDIDSDFSDRDYLLSLLREEFGSDNVIAISNLNTFKLKSLVKDIARYYDIPFEETNNATRWLERDIINGAKEDGIEKHNAKINFENAMKYSPEFVEFIERHPEINEFVVQLDKQTRGMGRHAGGVIVSENILQRMPVIVSRGVKQTPWVEAQIIKQLEPFGWVKFDLLGLDTLRIIERCIQIILQRHEGIQNPTFEDVKSWYDKNLAPESNDYEDQKVYEHVFHEGRWAGIFQATNKATQKFFKAAKPRSIVDIAALTSIYRPGPLAADVDKLYVGARDNPESKEKQHELIEQVLQETEGFLVFQEQAMALGNVVAGLPLDECDTLRKVVSKKPTKEDPLYEKGLELQGKFIEGSITNGVEKEEAEALYQKMMDFAAYSFNKCLEENVTVTVKRDGKIYDNIRIKDVVIGDYVDSRNGFVKVLDKINTGIKPVYTVCVENDLGCVKCTLDHKLETNQGMKTVREIVEDESGDLFIYVKPDFSFEWSPYRFIFESGEAQTYDLEVDHPDHTFYAGGISVSNSHAVSYSINSYLCAWLLTYYEPEWLCAYMESQSHDPDDKANALLELRSFGYEVLPLDINLATESWTILPDKKFMPSLSTCKGVGRAAIEEIKEKRPYKNIYDFLWNEDGTWKHTKANKKVIGNLIKIEAFKSLDCVGEGKVFVNYKQMHDVLIENWNLLRKTLKKDNLITQMEKLHDLIESGPLVETSEKDEKGKVIKKPRGPYSDDDWTMKEKIVTYLDLMGEINISLIVPDSLVRKMELRGIPAIDQFPENVRKKAVWFICVGRTVRLTKSGKKYLSVDMIGLTGKKMKLYIWNWDGEEFDYYRAYGAIIEKTDWGYSTSIDNVRKLEV